MGRPATYSTEQLLAVAAELFASGGTRALTMSAVARAAGAPSGSVYHRFPDRPALLAALWLGMVTKFQDDYRQVVGEEPTTQDAVRAAEWIVEWCRDNPAPAMVLQAGVRAFSPEFWSAASKRELARIEAQQTRAMDAVVERISAQTGVPADETRFALFDLPLAAVRRHLIAGQAPPPRVRVLVRELSRTIFRAQA
jgi:AcrR family transcriptional regulator